MRKNYLIILLVCQFTVTSAWAFNAFTVKSIQIEGLQRVSKDAVLQDLFVQPNQRITPADTANIIRSIYNTGFFKHVALERDGNILIVKLTERPTIGEFELLGIKNKGSVIKILKDANIATGRIYDPTQLRKAEQEIERHYFSKGHYGIQVQSEVTYLDKRNRVAIKMDIYTGDEARIRQINIVGNTLFPAKALLKELHHAPTNWTSWLTKDDRYAKEKLVADLEKISSYYMDRGYVNFQVDSTQVSIGPDKKGVYITINVSEGEQYSFGDITVSTQQVVPHEELLEIVDKTVEKGGIFSRKGIFAAKESIEVHLGNMGYSKTQVRLRDEVNEQNKTVNVNFFVDPGLLIKVRRIDIIGNNITQDEVLRRGFTQFEGSAISTKKIKESKAYMLREGFADDAEIEYKPVRGKDDQVDVLFKVDHSRTLELAISGGYETSKKFILNASADLRNFLGTGRDVDFEFQRNGSTKIYQFGYYNPCFFEHGAGMGFNAYHEKSNYSKTSAIFEYGINSTGADLKWSFPLSQYNHFTFGLTTARKKLLFTEDALHIPVEARTFVQKEGKDFTEYSTTMGWHHKSFDHYLFPTTGAGHHLKLKVILPMSKLNYYEAGYNFNWYHSLSELTIFNFGLDLGYKASYKHNQYFPFFEHYHAGGFGSVRGYAEGALGPLDSLGNPIGGNALVVAKASLQFPKLFNLDTKNVRPCLFLDAGQVYDTNPGKGRVTSRPRGLRFAVGLGIIWHTAIAPIELSYSTALYRKGEERSNFSFQIKSQVF